MLSAWTKNHSWVLHHPKHMHNTLLLFIPAAFSVSNSFWLSFLMRQQGQVTTPTCAAYTGSGGTIWNTTEGFRMRMVNFQDHCIFLNPWLKCNRNLPGHLVESLFRIHRVSFVPVVLLYWHWAHLYLNLLSPYTNAAIPVPYLFCSSFKHSTC